MALRQIPKTTLQEYLEALIKRMPQETAKDEELLKGYLDLPPEHHNYGTALTLRLLYMEELAGEAGTSVVGLFVDEQTRESYAGNYTEDSGIYNISHNGSDTGPKPAFELEKEISVFEPGSQSPKKGVAHPVFMTPEGVPTRFVTPPTGGAQARANWTKFQNGTSGWLLQI